LRRGYYVEPTLFTGVRNDMVVAREEIFGPVISAIPFRDEAEAIALANDSDYGLYGYVWTRDTGARHPRRARAPHGHRSR
jgi:acyl-CoA reductase-like NAD-dependent aldehyde dehydrogenase